MSKTIKENDKSFSLPKNIEEYNAFFSKLPKAHDRKYEVFLSECAKHYKTEDIEILKRIINNFSESAKERSGEEGFESDVDKEKVAYAAFYVLNIIYRNLSDNPKLECLIRENEYWVKKHDTFVHLNALRYVQMGESSDIDVKNVLEEEYKFAQKYHDNVGYCHAFCDVYATFCERNESTAKELAKEWSDRAVREIEYAINLAPTYAKYYCTKGRLLALDKQYIKAEKEVRTAIRLEDSSRSDYAVRISTYYANLLQIQSRRMVEEAKAQIGAEKIREDLGDLKHAVVSNVEIIAFFSGVISFVIGSLTLAKDQSATDAALLIITLMGCLIAVFSSFGVILHLEENSYRKKGNIAIAIIGIVIAIAALLGTILV